MPSLLTYFIGLRRNDNQLGPVLTDLTSEGFTHRSYDQVSAFHDHVSHLHHLRASPDTLTFFPGCGSVSRPRRRGFLHTSRGPVQKGRRILASAAQTADGVRLIGVREGVALWWPTSGEGARGRDQAKVRVGLQRITGRKERKGR